MKPFEQVVADHGATVLRVVRAVLGPHDAEEAWSETFLAALRAYPDLAPDINLEVWLVTTAKRKAIDQHRVLSRLPLPVDALPETTAARSQPEATAADDGLADDELYVALRSLPRKQREAIAYHHLAGLPFAQVAEILDNSESADRRAADDGMKRLREIYRGARR